MLTPRLPRGGSLNPKVQIVPWADKQFKFLYLFSIFLVQNCCSLLGWETLTPPALLDHTSFSPAGSRAEPSPVVNPPSAPQTPWMLSLHGHGWIRGPGNQRTCWTHRFWPLDFTPSAGVRLFRVYFPCFAQSNGKLLKQWSFSHILWKNFPQPNKISALGSLSSLNFPLLNVVL